MRDNNDTLTMRDNNDTLTMRLLMQQSTTSLWRSMILEADEHERGDHEQDDGKEEYGRHGFGDSLARTKVPLCYGSHVSLISTVIHEHLQHQVTGVVGYKGVGSSLGEKVVFPIEALSLPIPNQRCDCDCCVIEYDDGRGDRQQQNGVPSTRSSQVRLAEAHPERDDDDRGPQRPEATFLEG